MFFLLFSVECVSFCSFKSRCYFVFVTSLSSVCFCYSPSSVFFCYSPSSVFYGNSASSGFFLLFSIEGFLFVAVRGFFLVCLINHFAHGLKKNSMKFVCRRPRKTVHYLAQILASKAWSPPVRVNCVLGPVFGPFCGSVLGSAHIGPKMGHQKNKIRYCLSVLCFGAWFWAVFWTVFGVRAVRVVTPIWWVVHICWCCIFVSIQANGSVCSVGVFLAGEICFLSGPWESAHKPPMCIHSVKSFGTDMLLVLEVIVMAWMLV